MIAARRAVSLAVPRLMLAVAVSNPVGKRTEAHAGLVLITRQSYCFAPRLKSSGLKIRCSFCSPIDALA